MAGHQLCFRNKVMFVDIPNIYVFGGFIFEYHDYCGPTKLKKDFSEAKKTGKRFFEAVQKWYALSKEERSKFQVEG